MKTYIYLIFWFALFASPVLSQEFSLDQFNANRNQINATAMLTLGGWAISNIAVNTAFYAGAKEDEHKYFYQMNAAWNVINLAIAGFGYYGSTNPDGGLSLYASLQEQAAIEKILLFNAGLDVAYIMTGFYLIERSKNSAKYSNQLKGYGKSLILQGGFLFAFDLVVYYLQHQNHKLAANLLSNMYFKGNEFGIAFYF